MMDLSKADLEAFREKTGQWQEAYMDYLHPEGIA